MVTKKQPPTTTNAIWFRDPASPTKDELIAFAQDLDTKYPNDTNNRGFVRKQLRSFTSKSNPWEALGMNWAEFKRQCGFTATRAATKLLTQASKHASMDSIRSGSEERLTWGSKYTKPNNTNRYKTIMAASDFHDIEVDEFALRMFLRKVSQTQPDVVCIHGDLFDAPEFSKHFQDPREYNLRGRITKAHDILKAIRDAAPDAQIDLIEGNHEARIHRHILEVSPATADILDFFHGMGIAELLSLDQFKVNYVAKGDLFSFSDAQLKRSVMESERIYWGTIWARHHPPKQTSVTIAGFHGHHHAHEVTTYMNPITGSFEWHQTGGMHRRQASYADGRKWNLGFLYCIVDTKHNRASFDYTYVGDTHCQLGAEFHERKPSEYYPALTADLSRKCHVDKS